MTRTLWILALPALALTWGIAVVPRVSAGDWFTETVDDRNNAGMDSCVVLDSKSRPVICYSSMSGNNVDLKLARFNGTAWEIELVEAGGQTGYHCNMVLDTLDHPHIVYWDLEANQLIYTRYAGAAWQSVTVDPDPATGQYPSVKLDDSEYPHISYYSFYDGLKYAVFDGSDWILEVVDDTESQYLGCGSDLILDASGTPHIAYYGGHADWSVKYAVKSQGSWDLFTVDAEAHLTAPHMARDSSGAVHIFFSNWTTGQIKHAVQAVPGTPFSVEAVLPGYCGDMTLVNDVFHICWGGEYMNYAWKPVDSGTWQTEEVEPESLTGPGKSIAVSGNGDVNIAYYFEGLEDLRHAWKKGSPAPTQTPVPTVTAAPEIPTATPGTSATATPTTGPDPAVRLDLRMPSHRFGAGDLCSLDLELANSGPACTGELAVLLDVQGAYYCYPGWNPLPEGFDPPPVTLSGGYSGGMSLIPPFTIPDVPPMGPMYCYAALFEPGSLDAAGLLSNISVWGFWLN